MLTRLFGLTLCIAAAGCADILGIPSEGKMGCPEPCTVTVNGHTVRAESTSTPQLALSGVTVKLTSVNPVQTVTTGTDGFYAFTGLPPDTTLQFQLTLPADPQGLNTQYTAGSTSRSDVTIDLPVVQFDWLAQVLFQCDIFHTPEDAIANAKTYFQERSTVIGQVQNADGTPAAAFDRTDILVELRGPSSSVDFPNFQGNPADMGTNATTTVCLLESGDLGQFVGKNEEHSPTGRFVMFRVRNALGTGTGKGQVKIPKFPPGPLDISAGSVGFARMTVGDGVPVPDRIHTFERDVYHWFKDEGCSDLCHKPGGLGYVNSPKRPGADGTTLYPADWSASVDDVFKNLTLPVAMDCQLGGDHAARVCPKPNAKASLLYINPTGMGSHDGRKDLTDQDPMIISILAWINDGETLR